MSSKSLEELTKAFLEIPDHEKAQVFVDFVSTIIISSENARSNWQQLQSVVNTRLLRRLSS